MGFLQYSIIHFLLLLLFSFTAPHQSVERLQGRVEEHMRALIGSRPPTCEKRCRACSRCEAIQVPVITQETKTRTIKESQEYYSNYKPLSWKCKCGSFIFDP